MSTVIALNMLISFYLESGTEERKSGVLEEKISVLAIKCSWISQAAG